MRRRLADKRRRELSEVNVTAFLSLMVALVPFLLVTSVFSQVVILDLQLNPFGGDQSTSSDTVPLTIIVREGRIEVVDHPGEPATRINNGVAGPDLATLSRVLQELKSASSERLDASILMEPQLSYDALIQVMDTVRLRTIEENGDSRRLELFPRITIGDAPRASAS
jgi:biopolymer transport protein ExbD